MYVKNIQSIQQNSTINKAVDSIYLNTNNGKLYLKNFFSTWALRTSTQRETEENDSR